jgi:branched-chain amino acid aminotransferase
MEEPLNTPGASIWFDGEFVDNAENRVGLLAHTLHYGLGAFEGIRCYHLHDGQLAIFRLRDHLRRLFDSAKVCEIRIPYSVEDLSRVCIEVVRRGGNRPLYIRPLVFIGEGSLGLNATQNRTHICVIAWEFGPYLGEEGIRRGIRAQISTFMRVTANSSMAKAKIVGQYSTMVLAKQEAMRLGFDEAILLDSQGFVTEASAENVFAVRDGIVWTAPLTSSIIAGFTRDSLIRFSQDLGIEVREESFSCDFLWLADEVFLASTASEVVPVREINGHLVGTGLPGPITCELQSMFLSAVHGENRRYEDWLTLVEPI